MPTYAKLRTDAVIFNPVAPASVPEKALFSDSAGADAVTVKNPGGSTGSISGSSALYLKVMQSGFAGSIAIGTPLSKLASGKVVPADSDAANGQMLIGFATEGFPSIDTTGVVHVIGQNVANIFSMFSFLPGEEIYLSETGSYTDDPNSFTGDNDSIIKIGVADCAAGSATALGVDLIIMPQVITRPPNP